MDAAITLTGRLENFFGELAVTVKQWEEWLVEQQTAVVSQNLDTLNRLTENARPLFDRLESLVKDRQQLITDAVENQLHIADLRGLANKLSKPDERSLVEAAQKAQLQFGHLKRLHVATWVLVHESSHLLAGTMSVLLDGQSKKHTYQEAASSDMGGGQLIDTDI